MGRADILDTHATLLLLKDSQPLVSLDVRGAPRTIAGLLHDVGIAASIIILTEGVDGSGLTTTYYSTEDLFADDASATVALREIYAQVPMYLPYTNGAVKLGGTWIYNGPLRKPHASCDYSKSTSAGEDPGFRVWSIASGHDHPPSPR